MKQIKPFLSFEGQIERLRAHGCNVEDSSFAQAVLSQINYYRFSAYFLPFKGKDGKYREGTSFNSVFRIYEFDQKLRGILFAAVARIEVFLRAQLAHYHAEQYDPLGYLSGMSFRAKGHDHARFTQKINDEVRNNAKVAFVQHHIQNYNSQFPVWVIIELFTFGMLSRFYLEIKDMQRIFGMLLVLKELYPDNAGWNREVFEPIRSLFMEYQSDIKLRHIGFPQNWEEMLMVSGESNSQ